jgi:glycosyltransferase involved in cell wall biosynthesis
MKTVDIVVPCFNEAEVVETFLAETERICGQIAGYRFSYIFVDDGSRDATLPLLRKMQQENERVHYLSFSRNFGKEAAMYAGLKHTSGDYVIVMDADLQHPPALIPQMVKELEAGHDCAAACRSTRDGEKGLRSLFSSLFYRFSNSMSDVKMPQNAVDFRMMTRQMVDAILSLSEVERFSKGIFVWVGFDTVWIPYENVERTLGTSKWSFKGLLKYAIDGITAFTVKPLKLIRNFGILLCGISLIYILATLIKTLIMGIDVPGYASLLCITLFLGGTIQLSIGVVGEYVAHIYLEAKDRPVYILKETDLAALPEGAKDAASGEDAKEAPRA